MSTNILTKPLLNPSPVLTRPLMLGGTQLIASNNEKTSKIEHVNPGNYRRRLQGMIRKLKSMKIAPKTRNHAGRLLIERSEIAKANLMNSLQCLSGTLSQIIILDASIQRNERKQERKRLLRERTNKLSEIARVMDSMDSVNSKIRNLSSVFPQYSF